MPDVDIAAQRRVREIAKQKVGQEIAQEEQNQPRYNPRTQPRTDNGRFQKILARLKINLGDTELEQIVQQVDKTAQAGEAGDYQKSTQSAERVISMVDGIKSGSIDESTRNALRQGAADLGRVLAYLPLPQGVDTATVRFSDLPPSTRTLIRNLIERVLQKLKPDEAREVVATLNHFISGVDMMTADQLSSEMNKLMRFLV